MNAEHRPWRIRPAIALALALAVLLSGWAMWSPLAETPAEAVVASWPMQTGSPDERQVAEAMAAAPMPDQVLRTQPLEWKPLTRQQRNAWEPPEPEPARPPPPPPPPADLPPAKPVAPAVPYRFIGRLEEGSRTRALLDGPVRSLAVQAGDVLDAQWRVERIDGAVVHLSWLPDSSAHTLRLSSTTTP